MRHRILYRVEVEGLGAGRAGLCAGRVKPLPTFPVEAVDYFATPSKAMAHMWFEHAFGEPGVKLYRLVVRRTVREDVYQATFRWDDVLACSEVST